MAGVAVWGVSKWRSSQQAKPQYQTAVAQTGTLVVTVTASGQVSTVNSIAVNTSASGVVSQVYVQDGQQVIAGQALASLNLDQVSKQKYLSALAAYNSAKSQQYSLQNTLFTTNQKFINDAVARNLATDDPTYIEENANWLAAETSYQNQQNSINASALALQQASPMIFAPISGTVTGLTLQPGSGLTSSTSSTTTGQKIASIKTDAHPAITVNLTEIDVPKVKIGDKATVTFDALANKTFTGKVVSLDTVGSVSSGVVSYPAIIVLDSASVDILPNMSATVNIVLDTQTDVLLVPNSAIQTSSAGESTVQTDVNGKISTVNVTLGKASDTETVITSGLKDGDVVISGVINSTPNNARSATGGSLFSGIRGGGGNAVFRAGR